MKRILITISAVLILCAASWAEASTDQLKIGFGLTDSQGIFGLQGNITSPLFGPQDIFAAAVQGGAEFASADLFAASDEHWESFWSARAGLRAGKTVSGLFRLYGEFGGLCLFAENLTGEIVTPGIYGLFGFEFYTSPFLRESPVSYYIELGSSGTAAEAKDFANAGFYNGFKTSVGVRYHF